jgi:hypothetical protein
MGNSKATIQDIIREMLRCPRVTTEDVIHIIRLRQEELSQEPEHE